MKDSQRMTKPPVSFIKNFKTKDGRDPIAEKAARAKKFLMEHPFPEHLLKDDK